MEPQLVFGMWLRRKRKSLDLTQADLADQVGCSAAAIRKIESEERRPSVQIAGRLAEIFHIRPEDRPAFLRFARSGWLAAPSQDLENPPWLIPVRSPPGSKIHLATFLFTDIENSAMLWDTAKRQMKIALQRHHEILRGVIEANGGVVFQIIGDAFCAAFPTVPGALSAAVAAQQEFHRELWDLPFPIRVRMGIHTGEAEQTGSGEYASNPALNRVARILSAAHGGQVLISLATKDLGKDSMPENTELWDMGEHQLKNLISPEHLFQLTIAGLPSDFSPLNTLTHRHNLPTQMTSFIAREAELAVIHEYLSKEDIRLVTLIGPPGIGKTRLSVEAAREARQGFAAGVFFVALAPLDSAELIPPAIAQALGYVETKHASGLRQVTEGIRDRQILLILDNVEHLIEGAAPLISELLTACPRVKIVTTSRESLRIPGEWIYPVPALEIPTGGEKRVNGLEASAPHAALRLFAERARAVKPDFSLTPDNTDTIAAICKQLDGLPLAIELFAARIRLMTPKSLLAHLDQQFTQHANGLRTASARQKTLHHAINWSYSLLSEDEQRMFAYLSVFVGGFSISAAEGAFSQLHPHQPVADLITSLLDKSLLKWATNAQGEARFQMLVTIQQFAAERLREMGEENTARERHFSYFLRLVEQADQNIHGPKQVEWIELLEMDFDNLRAALGFCISEMKTEAALRMLEAIYWPSWLLGHSRELRGWFEKFNIMPGIATQSSSYARLLSQVGLPSALMGDYRDARALLEKSRAIGLELGPEGEPGLAFTLGRLGMLVLWSQGDKTTARAYFEESRALYQNLGDQRGIADSLRQLGMVAENRSDVILLEQSLDLFKQVEDLWGIARSSQAIGIRYLQRGDYERAKYFFEQHLRIDERLHFKQGIVAALTNMGDYFRYTGNLTQSELFYQRGIQMAQDYGLIMDLSVIHFCLGMLGLQQNDYSLARQQFRTAFGLVWPGEGKLEACDLFMGLSAVAAGTAQPERAARLSGAAQIILESSEYLLQPHDQTELERHLRIAREQIGDSVFEMFAAEGRTMTLEQAVAYALEGREKDIIDQLD